MNPGDKVRFLRSSGEGYIRKINPDKTVDVEIEDGFVIPVLQSEIVVIASEEQRVFNKPAETASKDPAVSKPSQPSSKGIFVVMVPFNDNIHKVELVNLSGSDILYTVAEEYEDKSIHGLVRNILPSGQGQVLGERKLSEMKDWLPLIFQLIFFRNEKSLFRPPLVRSVTFSPASFFRNKKKHPLTGKDAYIMEIDRIGKNILPDTLPVIELSDQPSAEKILFEQPPGIVDLHIDKITSKPQDMKADEILAYQLDLFEKTMENALASGLKEITFIHGSGNGTLKNRLHKQLGQNPNVEYFKDALKEKFGYGATFVKFR